MLIPIQIQNQNQSRILTFSYNITLYISEMEFEAWISSTIRSEGNCHQNQSNIISEKRHDRLC